MGVALYPLLSGDALYVGLFLVLAGVAAVGRHSKLGGSLVLVGLVLAVVSAVPIHPAAYGCLLILGAVSSVIRKRSHRVNTFVTASLLAAVAVVFVWGFAQRGASRLSLPRDRTVYRW